MNAIFPTASLNEVPKLPATEMPTNDVGILEHLIVLSLRLADLAFRQAHEEATPQPPEQAGPEQAAPDLAAPDLAVPDLATKQPRRPGRTDSRLIFLRLRRAIQETIAFKNRLIAGLVIEAEHARRQQARRSTPEPVIEAANPSQDPRRPSILRYFREAIDINEKKRKIPITQADVENRVDSELAKDPARRLQGRLVLLNICKSLDLPFYANRMQADLFRSPAPA